MTVTIDEGQRQMILLALAELALSRPGWDDALHEIAKSFGGDSAIEMFDSLKKSNADRVRQTHASLGPMVAQQDEPAIFVWLTNASQKGGGFVSTIAEAALRAEYHNYALIRPSLLMLIEKYPAYRI